MNIDEYQTNMYKIKSSIVKEAFSDLVSVEILLGQKLNHREIYRIVQGKFGGLVYKHDEMLGKVVAVIKEEYISELENEPEIQVLSIQAFDVSSLDKNKREKLLLNILKKKGHLFQILRHKQVIGKIENRTIRRTFRVSIESEGKEYYIVVLPRHEIIEDSTIMDLLIKGELTIEDLKINLIEKGTWKITSFRKDIDVSPNAVEEIILKVEDPSRYNAELKRINEYFITRTSLEPIDDSKYPDKYNMILITKGKRYSYHPSRAMLIRPVEGELQKKIHHSGEFLKALNIAAEYIKDIIETSKRATFEGVQIPSQDIYYKATFLENGRIIRKKIAPYYNIKNTFNWLFKNEPFEKTYSLIVPTKTPKFIKDKKIAIYLLYPKEFSKERTTLVSDVKSALDRVSEYFAYLRTISMTSSLSLPVEITTPLIAVDYTNLAQRLTKIFEKYENYDYHLAITFVPSMSREQFDRIKKFFFERGIIHKAINIDNLNSKFGKNKQRIIESVILQALYAFGIYFYSLDNLPYDIIIGIDVTREKDKNGKYYGISGAAVVQNKNGEIIKIVPITQPQSSSETVDVEKIFESLQPELDQIVETKSNVDILILRDGRIPSREIEQLKRLSLRRPYTFTLVGIIKRPLVRFFKGTDRHLFGPKPNYYFRIGDTYYLTSHFLEHYLKVPLKLERKYVISRGKLATSPLNHEDILAITKLTKLNYSQPKNPDRMKLPAPVHLSHRLINYERRGLRFARPEFLQEGALYFL
ncbi:hypothetical protein TEU_01520 [Thermococcus eurythermalis]|uniref:Piwi domain-containing protein n=1 Tax=Thermococcus eurythermalis TaxID=1505907 RepID=A0A097QRL6_9EURY|nr:Piwi domain-containing protein [Thermococcus eurythermalis]AIU69120.1 hypothetical protein TEU_01520 [Thermococcus eurythermalis]